MNKAFNVIILNVNDAPTGIELEVRFTLHENMLADSYSNLSFKDYRRGFSRLILI